MLQLILHLVGDYITQSDWMAQNKTKRDWPALVHAFVYSLPFMFLVRYAPRPELALGVICATHFLIDRYRLARYVVWAKNWLGPKQHWRVSDGRLAATYWEGDARTPPFSVCRMTGYSPDQPQWLAVWLLIIADNTLHLAINYIALRWL